VWFQYEPTEEVEGLPVDQDTNGLLFTAAGRCFEPDPSWQQFARRVDPPAHTHVAGMLFEQDRDSVGRGLYLPPPQQGATDVLALAKTPGGLVQLAYPHFEGTVSNRRPFFVADNLRTFFVERVELAVMPLGVQLAAPNVGPASVAAVQRAYYGLGKTAAARLGAALAGTAIERAAAAAPDLRAAVAPRPHARMPLPTAKLLPAGWTLQQFVDVSRLTGRAADAIGGALPPTLRVYRFRTGFHPFAERFVEICTRGGPTALLRRDTQLATRDTFDAYGPQPFVVHIGDKPVEEVDFAYEGVYSLYNWELFFHLPMLIACRLMQNQRFEDARRWFHLIFDPTDTSPAAAPARFWQTRPFHEMSQAEILNERITALIDRLAQGRADDSLAKQVSRWSANPGRPHVLADLRLTAYMRNVVMKYLDNLIAWGDQLFARDTRESVDEATGLYVLAAELLGPRPAAVPPRARPQVHTYASLHTSQAEFSDPVVEVEYLFANARPDAVVATEPGRPGVDVPTMAYFCVPGNDKLLSYWDTVADRLFKIRSCRNLSGVQRQLPLFEPPIDPALLVRAAAAGLDIGAVLDEADAPPPGYRFAALAAKAAELCGQVQSLGTALLAAREKRDTEHLALLRAGHEAGVLAAVEQVRVDQAEEARRQHEDVLPRARESAVERWRHYQRLLGKAAPAPPPVGKPVPLDSPPALAAAVSVDGLRMTPVERLEFQLAGQSHAKQAEAADLNFSASVLGLLGDLELATKPFGVGFSYRNGSSFVGRALRAVAEFNLAQASGLSHQANLASKVNQLILREADWVLQSNLAAREIMHLDQQILAAEIRQRIADKELANHRTQVANAGEVREFLARKFTGQLLYEWMVGQVSAVYFSAYRLAFDLARRAERAYRHELGLTGSSVIRFGSWDSLRKGLLAGDSLLHDLRRMEADYLQLNRREYELTQTGLARRARPERAAGAAAHRMVRDPAARGPVRRGHTGALLPPVEVGEPVHAMRRRPVHRGERDPHPAAQPGTDPLRPRRKRPALRPDGGRRSPLPGRRRRRAVHRHLRRTRRCRAVRDQPARRSVPAVRGLRRDQRLAARATRRLPAIRLRLHRRRDPQRPLHRARGRPDAAGPKPRRVAGAAR
jgi:hypothetical protein